MDSDDTVTVVRTIGATVERVFAAWTDAALLQPWLAPAAEADPRVGGRFRLEVTAEGEVHVVTGEYRELVPGRRIVAGWVYKGSLASAGTAESVLTVDFTAAGAGTDIRLCHAGLTDPGYREVIRQGAWPDAFGKLEAALTV
jgi:uncharacterized protein YndB with AHSA1/START domain